MSIRIFLLIAMVCAGVFAQSGKPNIAVSDLIGQGIDQPSTSIISDRLRTELVRSGFVSVLERNAMQEILKEQGFQQAGCTSNECAVEIGQLLGVSHMVVGSVGKLGKLFTLDIRLIDVATGKINYSESVDCRGPVEEVLRQSVPVVAKKILERIKNPDAAVTAGRIGGISVETKPTGATLYVNGKREGITPYTNKNITVGMYSLRLTSKDVSDFVDTVEIVPGKIKVRKYDLASGKIVKDAVAPLPVGADIQMDGKKSRLMLRLSLSAAALVVGGAGFACNYLMQQKVDEKADIEAEYRALGDDSRLAEYDAKVKRVADQATAFFALRNGCYVLTGLSVAGLAVTFVF